jgi:hypothetical protein
MTEDASREERLTIINDKPIYEAEETCPGADLRSVTSYGGD